MRLTFIAAAAGVLLLASPAAHADPLANFWSNLLTFTHADFVAADADAQAHNDPIASECWEGADAYLSSQTANGTGFVPPGTPVGALSLFQATRDTVKFGLSVAQNFKATGKVPAPLEQACGPLFVDSIDDLRTVGNTIGLGAFNLVLLNKPLF